MVTIGVQYLKCICWIVQRMRRVRCCRSSRAPGKGVSIFYKSLGLRIITMGLVTLGSDCCGRGQSSMRLSFDSWWQTRGRICSGAPSE